MEYACYIYNHLPRPDTGLAPIEILSSQKLDESVVRSARTWGCPVYVLDPKIQDGKKFPKWEPRSRRGQFLGRSRRHASNIGLIRNVNTGSITTQFHVVYDDHFTTLPSTTRPDDVTIPDNWVDLITFDRECFVEEEDLDENVQVSDEWLNQREQRERQQRRQRGQPQGYLDAPIEPPPADEDDVNDGPEPVVETIEEEEEGENESEEDEPEPEQPRGGRSQRNRVPNPRYYGPEFVNMLQEFKLPHPHDIFLVSRDGSDTPKPDSNTSMHNLLDEFYTDSDGLLNETHPFAFAAKANSDDTPSFHDAMYGPDSEGFYKAMEDEITTLEGMEAWEIVDRSQALGKNILDGVWAFKRKRFPDGRVRKLKARFCVRGDQQIEGVDFFDTYAPVVSWSTVRLMLIAATTLGLASKQVDYTLVFIHADVDSEVYVEMPRLFEQEGKILKLKRNVYGLRQAPKNFFLYLKEGLEGRGFVQSQHDPCLFISDKVICVAYVDDCLFFAKDEADIDALLEDMKKPNPNKFLLNIEDDVAGFLGILMKKHEDGSIELLQTGLIDRILKVTGLDESADKYTPAENKPLLKDENGSPCVEPWSYPSVVGMLMYLATNSRPDVAFAVNQCARFTHCPKKSHEMAIKRIIRYLKATKDKGMIISPDGKLNLDLYVDADFAGLWNVGEADDPSTVRSRTGYVMTLGGVPVLWGSKLQTEIALSTMEAEYIALSMGMRELVPARELIKEIADGLKIERDESSTISKVWEDNNGCLLLASSPMPKVTPRSKHFGIKYHWFREKVDGEKIKILPIDTKEQLADIFTKGLTRQEFENKRKPLMGW